MRWSNRSSWTLLPIRCWPRSMTGRWWTLRGRPVAFTTDSFVVSPIFFPGGCLGDLAVNGTVNDLAACGAQPLALSAGFVIEEGFAVADLERVVGAMAAAANAAGVPIVTGDTKVVERGKGDGCYVNTSGIGLVDDAGRVHFGRRRQAR